MLLLWPDGQPPIPTRSSATVRSYGRAVHKKLGVGTRAKVVLKALSLGLSQVAGF